jgi:transposase
MTEQTFYKELLKLDENWQIKNVEIDETTKKVLIHMEFIATTALCPFSKELCPIYDHAPVRSWRHLDTMQYQTWLVASVPRVTNSDGKVSTIAVPWADHSERYSYLFCAKVIQLLQLSKNQTKTAEFFKTSFDVVNAIMKKAVERGLAKRSTDSLIESIGIDEKSFQKGHHYCTIITDATNKCILEVVEGRTKDAAKEALNKSLTEKQKESLKIVTGDMWEAYQTTVREVLPKATYVLDRFHLIKYLNIAIDKTRRAELKDHPILKLSRFTLLKNPENLSTKQMIQFNNISAGKTLFRKYGEPERTSNQFSDKPILTVPA